MRSVSSPRGEHDHRGIGVGAQLAAQAQAVLTRQHQIEHDQIDLAARKRRPHRLAVGDQTRLVAVLAQVLAEQAADLGVVVDDQDMVRLVHRVIYTGRPWLRGQEL